MGVVGFLTTVYAHLVSGTIPEHGDCLLHGGEKAEYRRVNSRAPTSN